MAPSGAMKFGAAALAVLVLAMLALVLSIAGFGALNSCDAQASTGQPAASDDAKDIPADYLTLYRQAGTDYQIPWVVLAAIGKAESDHGRDPGSGVRSGSNWAGAAGPMQIGIGGAAGNLWDVRAVDGKDVNGTRDGKKVVYDPADAIPTAAVILIKDKGYRNDTRTAIRRYNGSGPQAEAYADKVLEQARKYAAGDFSVGSPNQQAGIGCANADGFNTPPAQTADAKQCAGQSMGAENITNCMRNVRDQIKGRFSPLKTIGCFRNTGDPQDHGRGRACDFMVSNGVMPSATGTQVGFNIANWAAANAGKIGIRYIIWRQRIWNIELAAEGWRPMENRGSVTANHYDHVHISVY